MLNVQEVAASRAGLEFRVLGPVEARWDGVPLPLGGAKPRLMLLTLLLAANRPVRHDRLVRAVWSDHAPPSARANVRSYVAELRRMLRLAGAGDRLIRQPGGLLVRVGPGELDAIRFADLVERARRANAQASPRTAVMCLRHGLALWRGEVGGGALADSGLQADAAVLEAARIAAVEDLAEALLQLGQHGEAAAELRRLVAVYPFREPSWARLIRALYAGGDVAAALDAYSRMRALLVGELGLEPGEHLRELHRAILRRDRFGDRRDRLART